MAVMIRKALPRDAMGIGRVHVESWRETYAGILPTDFLVGLSQATQARRWRRRIRSVEARNGRGDAMFVAVDDRCGVVGFGDSGPSRDPSLDFAAEIYMLYVHPDHVNRGIGSHLLRRLFDDLVGRGIDSAIIWALADNPSRHFYSAVGGRVAAERMSRYFGCELREIGYGWPSLIGWREMAR